MCMRPHAPVPSEPTARRYSNLSSAVSAGQPFSAAGLAVRAVQRPGDLGADRHRRGEPGGRTARGPQAAGTGTVPIQNRQNLVLALLNSRPEGQYVVPMDEVDTEIVDLLQADARLTQAQIAKKVGLSQPSVADRIRKLEERGSSPGTRAKVDPRKLGKDITAFIGVAIEHPKYFDGFARKVMGLPEVLECHRVAGQDSYLLKVRPRTPAPSTGSSPRSCARCPASPGPRPSSSSAR